MLRKLTIVLISAVFCWTALAFAPPVFAGDTVSFGSAIAAAPKPLADGQYPVQQATYNDADGEYSLMLLNTPRGASPAFNTQDLQMARLSDEDIASGATSYLKLDKGQAALYLTEDFKIEYVRNVTETQPNPQTGEPQTVIVRRESSFWTPFAGAIAGQMVANALFRPMYYVPPVYHSGGVMAGYGGVGRTYDSAVNSYQKRYNKPPAAVKNRQNLRTSGNLRNRSSNRARRAKGNKNRATGSGFGSSRLRQSKRLRSPGRSNNRFGSGMQSRPRMRSFGRRRR